MEFKATKYKGEKDGCFMIKGAIHQEVIKIMNPPSTHIFYLYAPNNMALKIKQKKKIFQEKVKEKWTDPLPEREINQIEKNTQKQNIWMM